jgi:hypothetical protein
MAQIQPLTFDTNRDIADHLVRAHRHMVSAHRIASRRGDRYEDLSLELADLCDEVVQRIRATGSLDGLYYLALEHDE